MTKKKRWLVLGLATVGVLGIVGGAFAAYRYWVKDATSDNNEIQLGEALEMSLTGSVASHTGILPGDSVVITLTADNKNIGSTLTMESIKNEDDAESVTVEGSPVTYASCFDVTYKLGEGTATDFSGSETQAASARAVTITMTFTLKTTAPVEMAGKKLTVTFKLDQTETAS